MKIREHIEKLEEIESNAKWLAKQINMDVDVYVSNSFIIRIGSGVECKYCEEFDTIGKLSNHLDAMAYGVMLSKGIEI